jgi:hypothetical protein
MYGQAQQSAAWFAAKQLVLPGRCVIVGWLSIRDKP